MRILLPPFNPFLPVPLALYGGVERIVALLLAELRRGGHEVGLLAHLDSMAAADYFLGWPYPWPKFAAAHARNTLALLRAVRRFRPSIIQFFSRLLYLAPLLGSRTGKSCRTRE